jgi:hypothetical protein
MAASGSDRSRAAASSQILPGQRSNTPGYPLPNRFGIGIPAGALDRCKSPAEPLRAHPRAAWDERYAVDGSDTAFRVSVSASLMVRQIKSPEDG